MKSEGTLYSSFSSACHEFVFITFKSQISVSFGEDF